MTCLGRLGKKDKPVAVLIELGATSEQAIMRAARCASFVPPLGKEHPGKHHVGGQGNRDGGFDGAGAGFGPAVDSMEGEHQKHTRCPPPRSRKKRRKYISIVWREAKQTP